MAISVDIDLEHAFAVKAPFKDVFDVLSDVPRSTSFFPKVDRLTRLRHGVYRWEMAKVSAGQISLQTVYTSSYVANRAQGTVVWMPVPGDGNAQVGGSWTITDHLPGTALVFKVQANVDLPLPGLMKMMVAPLVRSEFDKLASRYIENLVQHFGGRA